MRILVLYQESGEDATAADRDVLVQRDAVADSLKRLGHQAICLSCTLDLAVARRQLLTSKPDVVFNLVESLGGTDRLMVLATLLLDALQIPYTGTRTDAILATSNKLTAKRHLWEVTLPTPAWFPTSANDVVGFRSLEESCARGVNNDERWILKPVLEHASFGMDDDAIVVARDTLTLAAKLGDRQTQLGRPLFAEQFIDGREFNLSLLSGRVLPPAEIDFSAFPLGKPRIVGHQAKWEEASFEYQQTPRRFDFSATDALLLEQLSCLAVKCWELFDLSGYARVDFRVDREGQPWILEVNANPCLSPDAGFAAALSQAGITYDNAIERILEDALDSASLPKEL